jgi:uroporphyrinogen decarboxylase
MAVMTSRERYLRTLNHQESDRIPMTDSPWGETINRWKKEGLPENIDLSDYFGWDKMASYGGDWSLRLPGEVIEETAEYVISRSGNGAITKNFKGGVNVHHSSTQWIGFTMTNPQIWDEHKHRLAPTRDRINWDHLKSVHTMQENGILTVAFHPIGFDPNTQIFGQLDLLVAIAEQPDWVHDIFDVTTNLGIELFKMMIAEGAKFDVGMTTDDLGYVAGPFFSPKHFRELLKPYHKRFCDFCHENGMKTILHSCGNIKSLLPDLIDAGWDCINPVEVKAGMDLRELKALYGDKLTFYGGIDVRKMAAEDESLIEEEIRTKIECAKQNGGYIYHSDHSVPENVSFPQYQRVMELVRKHGSYQ